MDNEPNAGHRFQAALETEEKRERALAAVRGMADAMRQLADILSAALATLNGEEE